MPDRAKSKAPKPPRKSARGKRDTEEMQDATPDATPEGADCPEEQDKAAEAAFVESLIASGQAAKPDEKGRLPAGATHEITETKTGEVKVTRKRFSIY